jgi:hypothetical protein
VDHSLTRLRSPRKFFSMDSIFSALLRAMWTNPTGFSSVPPVGPAMPEDKLPDGFEASGADEPVAADDRNAEMDGGGCHDAVGQIGDFSAGHLAHGFDDGNGENGLGKNVFRVGERMCQFLIGRFEKAAFLDQIDQFSEAYAGNRNLAPCRRCPLDKGAGVSG